MITLLFFLQITHAQSTVRPYLALGAHVSGAGGARSHDPIITQGNDVQRDEAKFRFEPALGLGLEGGFLRPWNLGVFGGLEADTPRRARGTSATITNPSLQAALDNSTLYLGDVYVNLAYAFDWVFLFAGYNYTHVRLSAPEDVSPPAVGLLGIQLGAGAFFRPNWMAMVTLKRQSAKLEWRAGADFVDTQTLDFTGVQLGVRYAFY